MTQQATMIAYQNVYWLLMLVAVAMLPFALVVGSSRARKVEAAALD